MVRSLLFGSDLVMPTQSNESGKELSALRREITELVARNAVVMVQNAIDAVNEAGQYQAIKYLFEMIGLYPALNTEDDTPEASLAGYCCIIWEFRKRHQQDTVRVMVPKVSQSIPYNENVDEPVRGIPISLCTATPERVSGVQAIGQERL